ncbi:MAG: GGDEF domain-containing protein [Fibrobacter sp.]|nr:GGDEF domain-containing protein [Fibrobacter sp.]
MIGSDSEINRMDSSLQDSHPMHLKSSTASFTKHMSDTIHDITGVMFEMIDSSYEEKSFKFIAGMTVFISFYGKVQGEFIVGVNERNGLKIIGLENADEISDNEIPKFREDLSGFFKEVINVAAAQTIDELEKIYENLTYFPAIVTFGDIIFPDVKSSTMAIQAGDTRILCGFSLNMVKGKIARKLETIEKSLEKTTRLASTDALTKLYNRTFFESVFNVYIDDTRNNKQQMSLLLIDIDHFKNVNDSYGHLVGDQVISRVAQAIKTNVRNTDIAVRYGGDEILVVLPSTDRKVALKIAEDVSKAIKQSKIAVIENGIEVTVGVTVSIGCTVLSSDDDPVSLFERADGCLYQAKEAGRDRIICG